jgi:hypothetical protein
MGVPMSWQPSCTYCGKPVDLAARSTLRRVVGWERKAAAASRKAGSDVVMREPRDEYAHEACVALERAGVNVAQGSLL